MGFISRLLRTVTKLTAFRKEGVTKFSNSGRSNLTLEPNEIERMPGPTTDNTDALLQCQEVCYTGTVDGIQFFSAQTNWNQNYDRLPRRSWPSIDGVRRFYLTHVFDII